jgi:hypothetical protein
MKQEEQEKHGMKASEKLEIAMPGSSSWMPYAPQEVKGLDDDDDDDVTPRILYKEGPSRYCPGVAQRVPGGLGSQIFMTFGT